MDYSIFDKVRESYQELKQGLYQLLSPFAYAGVPNNFYPPTEQRDEIENAFYMSKGKGHGSGCGRVPKARLKKGWKPQSGKNSNNNRGKRSKKGNNKKH